MIDEAWRNGHKNVLYTCATGGGKTVLFTAIAAENIGQTCIVAHRQEIVTQISIALCGHGVKHRLIVPKSVLKFIITQQVNNFDRVYFDPGAPVAVASVDTMLRRGNPLNNATLWIQDEAHHIQKGNKWAKVLATMPAARGLGVTAEPSRADGGGLGRHADGVFDTIVEGPGTRELIDAGWLSEYEIVCPGGDIDLSRVEISRSTGDYSQPQLRAAVRKSKIIGKIVFNYLRFAYGRLGLTFVTDLETSEAVAAEYNRAGVPAAAIGHKTPDNERQATLERFRRRDILQLVNVDLFGEGFDLPAVEVVTMARPTESYNLYCLDPQTEILTRTGWAKWDEIERLKSVAAFDPKNDKISFIPALSYVYRKRYSGEKMYGIQAPHLDICVSDRHEMIVRSRSETAKNWQRQKAKDLAKRKSMFKIPVAGQGEFRGSGLSKSEIHFLGWFLSDGTLNKHNNAISISQSVAKTEHLKHIRKTLSNCGFRFGECVSKRKDAPKTHNDLIHFTISKGNPRRRTDRHLTGWSRLEEWIDKGIPDCYDRLNVKEFQTLLYTLNLGDGLNDHSSLDYNKNTLTIACGNNRQMADRLQALCVVRGLRCNLTTQKVKNRTTWYSLLINTAKYATIAGVSVRNGRILGKSYKRSRFEKLNEEPEFVWCVENKLGTLITRRNGKVAILGNCQQFGRALRIMDGKDKALIIDHVGNVERHNLPDVARPRSLDRREGRGRVNPTVSFPLRVCLTCSRPFEAFKTHCPYCGDEYIPETRNTPELVDGDLELLDADALAAIRQAVAEVDKDKEVYRAELVARHVPQIGQLAHVKRHVARQEAQAKLRESILWFCAMIDGTARERQKRFYLEFGIDTLTARTLNVRDCISLNERVRDAIRTLGVSLGRRRASARGIETYHGD